MKPKKMTFVCTGNTCRSVMAHKLLESMKQGTVFENVEIDSAGTEAMPYYSIVGDLKTVMDENGINYEGHVPKPIDIEILEDSDLVITMTETHSRDIDARFPGHEDKIKLLSELSGLGTRGIPDPLGMGLESYRETFRVIEKAVKNIIERFSDNAER
ncbi:low molecular weight protein arginine phosphatase [Elusimicrobiota bacterium]